MSSAVRGSIRVRGLGKRYGELTVFADVDLELRSREIVALVGPSGCGKTTLLRCIDGLIPCEGEVTIDGTMRLATATKNKSLAP